MAFLSPSPLSSQIHSQPLLSTPARRFHPRTPYLPHASLPSSAPTPSPSSLPPTTAPIPSSLADAASQAVSASRLALAAGKSRLFIEVDLTAGDATYTLLKSTLPLIKFLHSIFDQPEGQPNKIVHILFPDAGAAALALRDWNTIPANVSVKGLEQTMITPDDAGVIIVAPRASEVGLLPSVVDAAEGLPVVIVNPDLVDMGVTGLSLNARKLRINLIDSFEPTYYLKTFTWGLVLRAFPGNWGIWVDADNNVGFRLVKEIEQRPSNEQIDNVLNAEGAETVGVFGKIARFLNQYMKG